MSPRKVLAALAGVALLSVSLTGCDVAGGYVDKGKKVIGADNMEDQYNRVTTDWESLTAAADNACAAQATSKKADNDPTLVEDPALAYAATYRHVVVDYNARQENLFKAGIVGPPGYPKRIPDYTTGSNKADFCVIGDRLVALKTEVG